MRDIVHLLLDGPAAAAVPIRVGFVGSIGRSCFSDLVLRTCPGLETAYRTGSRTALLAALRSGRLDVAIYPGGPAADVGTMLLCEDHLVVAADRGHRIADQPVVPIALLRDAVLLPAEGEESDFRRLVQGLLPDIGRIAGGIVDAPIRDIGPRLAATDTLAIVTAGQCDELGGAIVTRPIAGRNTRFPVQLSWSANRAAQGWYELWAALRENVPAVSSRAFSPIIDGGGRWGDGSGCGGSDGVG